VTFNAKQHTAIERWIGRPTPFKPLRGFSFAALNTATWIRLIF
jgi:hypothetical protein